MHEKDAIDTALVIGAAGDPAPVRRPGDALFHRGSRRDLGDRRAVGGDGVERDTAGRLKGSEGHQVGGR